MKKKQNMILMIGMMSLVIFSSIIAVMMYLRSEEKDLGKSQMVDVYVASKDIHQGEQILSDMVDKQSLPSSYQGAEVVDLANIIGTYAKTDIEKNNVIHLSNVSLAPVMMKQEENLSTSVLQIDSSEGADRITIPATAFQNLDSSLKEGDRVDILSIAQIVGDQRQFSGKYIALNVLIVKYNTPPTPAKQEQEDKDKSEKNQVAMPSSLVLEMNPQQVSRFLAYYYGAQQLNQDRSYNFDNSFKGHMWIVKCSKTLNSKEQAYKTALIRDFTSTRSKPVSVHPLLPPPPISTRASERGIVTYEQ